MSKANVYKYENNPFYVGMNGLSLLFNKALSVAILALVLIGMGLFSQVVDAGIQIANGDFTKSEQQVKQENAERWSEVSQFFASASTLEYITLAVIVATVLFVVILVNLLIYGTLEYTAAQLSKNTVVTLGEALKAVFRQLASLLWLEIVIIIKVFLWSLLLVVPGIIMAVRYSLAATVFFREGLRGNAATKRSAELTKGAWFTTFASMSLWNLITFGIIQPLLIPGTNAVLYRQLAEVTDADKSKPPAHWLSWLTFFVPILLVLLLIGLAVLVVAALGGMTNGFTTAP